MLEKKLKRNYAGWQYGGNGCSEYCYIKGLEHRGGFSEEEARKIFPQILKYCTESRTLKKAQHILVQLNGIEIYLRITSSGSAELPTNKEGRITRTANPNEILDFRTRNMWESKPV
ncbi:MAG: hypothetical protein KKF68_03625 [Nanoarchaeota archaeon]|nr:hypothetical protein [Nanoarchaeota archaeon]